MWIVTESAPFDYDNHEVVGAYGPYESERDAQLIAESLKRLLDENLEDSDSWDQPWVEYKYEVTKLEMF